MLPRHTQLLFTVALSATAAFCLLSVLLSPSDHPHYCIIDTPTGTYGCIGKPLALLNLRTTLAKLILQFDLSFAAGEDGTAFKENARTQFNTSPGELYLKFSKRET